MACDCDFFGIPGRWLHVMPSDGHSVHSECRSARHSRAGARNSSIVGQLASQYRTVREWGTVFCGDRYSHAILGIRSSGGRIFTMPGYCTRTAEAYRTAAHRVVGMAHSLVSSSPSSVCAFCEHMYSRFQLVFTPSCHHLPPQTRHHQLLPAYPGQPYPNPCARRPRPCPRPFFAPLEQASMPPSRLPLSSREP